MLGKLLKYEFKATARLLIPLYLSVLVFALLNRFLLPIYDISARYPLLFRIAATLSLIIYVTLIVGMMLMTLIVMIQRFYKNLLGDEGYLMFTLPVQSWKHVVSKLTVSMFWTVASGIIAMCSVFIVASPHIFTPEFFQELSVVSREFVRFLGALRYLVTFEIILIGLLSLASTILSIYAAIALGHLFNKHKLLIAFCAFIVLRTISQILMVIFFFIFSNQVLPGMQGVNFIPSAVQISNVLLTSILYLGIVTTGYYVITNYILKRRLNLE